MKHLDLFSGYGGFTIPAQKYGIETIGFSEIDKYACSVLNYHYPNIKNYGDITKIKTEDLPTVDIITGGSPCQDLSVAGKGAGLNGERSGLFFYFINLIKEKQPTYFVWENVKGALSSQRGWDFARVQIEMEQAGYDVWWQVLNAKDFGVPQNRERIFAIGIRKGSGREILFEQISSGQNNTTNGKVKSARKFGSSGSFHKPDEIVSTLTQSMGTGGNNVPMTIGAKTGLYAVAARNRGNGKQAEFNDTGNANSITSVQTDSMVVVHNLQPRSPNRPSLLKNKNAGGSGHLQRQDGVTYTVDTGCTQGIEIIGSNNPNKSRRSQIAIPVLTPDRENKRQNGRRFKTDGESSFTLTGQDRHGVFNGMRIRRLTPTECERLMGLEDGWTAKGVIDGKEVEISDTQRYKMCGNGVVVNCVDYIYNLISKTL